MTTKSMSDAEARPWAEITPTGPILRTQKAAEYLGICVTSYYGQAALGLVPAPIKMGERATGVPLPWLDAVIAHRAGGGQ